MPAKVNITLSIPPRFAWQFANYWRDATGRAAILARFWSRVNRAKAKGADCWLWVGATNGHYGVFYVEGAQRIRAHRLSGIVNGASWGHLIHAHTVGANGWADQPKKVGA
jgi:hypothetical protein